MEHTPDPGFHDLYWPISSLYDFLAFQVLLHYFHAGELVLDSTQGGI